MIYLSMFEENLSTGSKDIPLSRPWPWKWGQSHQNQMSSSACHNDVAMKAWRKSIHWFKRYRGYKNLSSKSSCDLENEVKVNKILSALKLVIMMYLCKFEENPSTGSKDIPWLWRWKWGQGHQNLISLSHWCIHARLKKIHPLVQKILWVQEFVI